MSQEFLNAVRGADVDTARRLLETEPSLATLRDENGVSALLLALYHRAAPIVEVILTAHPELDLFEAAATGTQRRVSELLAREDVDVNALSTDGFTALHLACFFGHAACADALLEAEADPNATAANPSAVRPLHSAAAARSAEIVELLLRRGASVNARQHGGWTALHSAAQHDDVAMTRMLLDHGADPQQLSDDGRSAVDLAHEHDAERALALLEGK